MKNPKDKDDIKFPEIAEVETVEVSDQGMRETLVLEKQWDRLLSAMSRNLNDLENRSTAKSAAKALEAYLWDVLEGNEEYNRRMIEVRGGDGEDVNSEINRLSQWVKAMKKAIGGSKYAQPEIWNIE